jgi:hypothetical protein
VREQQGDILIFRTENQEHREAAPAPEPDPAGKNPRVTRHPVIEMQLFTRYGPEARGFTFTVAAP